GNGDTDMQQDIPSSRIDKFDRALGALVGIPGVTRTQPTTVRAMSAIVGTAQTFIVQTFRQREEDGDKVRSGDHVFIEYVAQGETVRIVLPPEVAKVI